jgi:transposase InsO family protein
MFLLVVDEATRFKSAYLMKAKSESADHVETLVMQFQSKFQQWPIVILHSDQGGEFLSNELSGFCRQEGIEGQFTNGYSPQENGIVERANGVITTRSRTLLRATMEAFQK